MKTKFKSVTVRLDEDEDGGLSTYSEDLPGLIMVGERPEEIGPAMEMCIKALIEYEGVSVISIHRSEWRFAKTNETMFGPGHVTYLVEVPEAA